MNKEIIGRLARPKALATAAGAAALSVALLAASAPSNPADAQNCDQILGTVGGAVIGGATGSLFGSGRGRRASTIGGADLGGALGSRRDEQARARCLAEREAQRDREMQRQLDFERQRMLQEEEVRREIEEQRLYEEWRKERLRQGQ